MPDVTPPFPEAVPLAEAAPLPECAPLPEAAPVPVPVILLLQDATAKTETSAAKPKMRV
jgi:hypothetical protein